MKTVAAIKVWMTADYDDRAFKVGTADWKHDRRVVKNHEHPDLDYKLDCLAEEVARLVKGGLPPGLKMYPFLVAGGAGWVLESTDKKHHPSLEALLISVGLEWAI